MMNILPIEESAHLTADKAMNTGAINSVNDSDMPIDDSSVHLPPYVSSHTWTASQNTESRFIILQSLRRSLLSCNEPVNVYLIFDIHIIKKIKFHYTLIMKSVAKQHKHTSADTIVGIVIKELVSMDGHFLSEPTLLIRAANRTRQKMRPNEPRDLNLLHLDKSQFPDKFLRKDIHISCKRHRRHGTLTPPLRMIRDPFKQSFSVHAFVKNCEHETNQPPLAFAFMSKRKKKDSKKVFKALKRPLLSPPTAKDSVADFEAGVPIHGECIQECIHGCAFHLGQLVDYVESTWITNIIFAVDSWSIFRKSVQTNNDVKGWRRRINRQASKANPAFVLLDSLLYDEATSAVTQILLKIYQLMQARIFSVWEEYQNDVIPSSK
ncbi:hypothetical protein ACJMK2_032573 [Sinanodonta woodiana]|uniref:Uncharacterized protein n=1 Tax=Sinanodonta woodiana TaxID=1069815 RepID=A0ABD3X2B9_SINWO